jgi:hypothetical protein
MTMARWFDGSNGRSSTRSMPAATIADRSIAMSTATAPGMSKALAMEYAMKAPIIAISPWAKLTTPVALKMRTRAMAIAE